MSELSSSLFQRGKKENTILHLFSGPFRPKTEQFSHPLAYRVSLLRAQHEPSMFLPCLHELTMQLVKVSRIERVKDAARRCGIAQMFFVRLTNQILRRKMSPRRRGRLNL